MAASGYFQEHQKKKKTGRFRERTCKEPAVTKAIVRNFQKYWEPRFLTGTVESFFHPCWEHNSGLVVGIWYPANEGSSRVLGFRVVCLSVFLANWLTYKQHASMHREFKSTRIGIRELGDGQSHHTCLGVEAR